MTASKPAASTDSHRVRIDLGKVDATTEEDIRRHMIEDGEIPERFTDSVDLGGGIRGLVVGARLKAADTYDVEVFRAPATRGSEVVTMVEGTDGKLAPADPMEWDALRRRNPSPATR